VQVIDNPLNSWLQHLHLLWLDERAEQERRRALLKLKMAGIEGHGERDTKQQHTAAATTPHLPPMSSTSHVWSPKLQQEMTRAPCVNTTRAPTFSV